MLPEINPEMTQQRLNFPTKWQAVIFRNYRVAPTENIAKVLGLDVSQVNVKATTEEHLGFTGDGSGMSCHAVCLLETL